VSFTVAAEESFTMFFEVKFCVAAQACEAKGSLSALISLEKHLATG
jgi:hypothetical protein